MGTKSTRVPAKISQETQRHLQSLLQSVSQNGWGAIGVKRADPPTQIALIEEAVKLLAKNLSR